MVEDKDYIETALEPLKSRGMIDGAYAIVSGNPILVDLGLSAERVSNFHSTLIAMTDAYAAAGRPCRKIAVQFSASNVLIGCKGNTIVAIVHSIREQLGAVDAVINNILENLEPQASSASFLQEFLSSGPVDGPTNRVGATGPLSSSRMSGQAPPTPGFAQMASIDDHDQEDRKLWNGYRDGLEALLSKVMSRGHAEKFIDRELKNFLRGDQDFPLPDHFEELGIQVINKVPVKNRRNLLLAELTEFLKSYG